MDNNSNELEIIIMMESIRKSYFPKLQISQFEVKFDASFEGVQGRAISGRGPKVILYYSDSRILEPRYRMGLVPVVAHELAHFVNPVDPESEMRKRLPAPMMQLWEELMMTGHAKCSLGSVALT
jgi:hypothetical protein